MEHAESYRRVTEEYALRRQKELLFNELVDKGIATKDWATYLIYGDEELEAKLSFMESFWSKTAGNFRTITKDSIKDLTVASAELSKLLTINKVLIFLTNQLLSQKSSGDPGSA